LTNWLKKGDLCDPHGDTIENHIRQALTEGEGSVQLTFKVPRLVRVEINIFNLKMS
jgi:hypothetical protein